jgi:hypothetical protein
MDQTDALTFANQLIKERESAEQVSIPNLRLLNLAKCFVAGVLSANRNGKTKASKSGVKPAG